MDSDTDRTERLDQDVEPEQGDVEAYWRRRVYVLAGGITLIGLVAWACSGSGHKRSTAQVRNAAATMSPAAALPVPGTTPSPTATVTVTATPTAALPEKKHAGDQCEAADVVVGVTPTGTVFKGKQHPRFGLSVVNTGRRACTFDVGPKALLIRISSGTDLVWSSARCVGGAGSNLPMLQRGVPYLATLDWDRRRCSSDTHAAPGTYVIAVGAPGVKTHREVFRLR
jgi:mRNA-degrading endonuclease toxin of MazEF toxin-antitoxin module